MDSKLKTVLLAASVFSASFLAVREVRSQTSANRQFAEYTVTYEYVNRTGEITTEDVLAVRKDGSQSLVSLDLRKDPNAWPPEHSIVDLSRGVVSNIDPLSKTLLNQPMSEARIAHYRFLPASCESAIAHSKGDTVTCEKSSHESRFGRPVIIGYLHHIDVNGVGVDEQYVLDPALDWTVLERRTTMVPEQKVSFIKRAISLQAVPPDAALFTVPADYAEAQLPSEYLDLFRHARGQTLTPKERTQKLDADFRIARRLGPRANF